MRLIKTILEGNSSVSDEMWRLREEGNVFACKGTEENIVSRAVSKGEAGFGVDFQLLTLLAFVAVSGDGLWTPGREYCSVIISKDSGTRLVQIWIPPPMM